MFIDRIHIYQNLTRTWSKITVKTCGPTWARKRSWGMLGCVEALVFFFFLMDPSHSMAVGWLDVCVRERERSYSHTWSGVGPAVHTLGGDEWLDWRRWARPTWVWLWGTHTQHEWPSHVGNMPGLVASHTQRACKHSLQASSPPCTGSHSMPVPPPPQSPSRPWPWWKPLNFPSLPTIPYPATHILI